MCVTVFRLPRRSACSGALYSLAVFVKVQLSRTKLGPICNIQTVYSSLTLMYVAHIACRRSFHNSGGWHAVYHYIYT